jgi:kinesin family protein 3/17
VDEREQGIIVSENLEAILDESGKVLANTGPYNTHSFVFDHVHDELSNQKKVYDTTARAVVDSALQGYNATIFAYGQTGTGKTFTMEGYNSAGANVEARGIIPRAIEQIFGHIQTHVSRSMRFLVRASYLQIYNEMISDLLKPDRSNLQIREDKKKGVFVDGLSEWVVRSPAEIYGLMERGGTVRATGETKMNELSSRSHAVFIVIAEQSETTYVDEKGQQLTPEQFQDFMHKRGVRRDTDIAKMEDFVRQSFRVGKLNLVDLAGSERVRLSGATGQRLEESKQINRSLSALGNVISALTDTKGRTHVPYRDSKLTRMLEDSLGGNCRTTMMAMISPALEAMVESISTLKFANRAKNIKNEARVNEDLDQKSLLRKYERELEKLRAELSEKQQNVVDKRRLLEMDEQRRRAEEDKMVAIQALEARSLEFMREKEEKSKLEDRIELLMGQMIRGESGEAMNQMSGTVQEHQNKLRAEYDEKVANLEKERESIEEEKAQVDRYKQLLLKQRDIMIALTQRLVERDEQIMALQNELDAYDRHHKELEEKLDEKTALLIKFRRISMEANASSPLKNKELTEALDKWSIMQEAEGSSSSGAANSSKEDLESIVASQRSHIRVLEQQLQKQGAGQSIREDESAQQLVGSLKTELLRLQQRNRELERAASQSSSIPPPPAGHSTKELHSLKERCDVLLKEREAVHIIIEHKIKVLVQSVSQAVGLLLQSVPKQAGSLGTALSKDVNSLERLVNASISALHAAATAK